MEPSEPRRPRLATHHPATYRPRRAAAPPGAPPLGEVLDISESGLRLRTAEELDLGVEVDLEIVVGGELLFARGRVVRVRARGNGGLWDCGLRWTGIPTETLYALLYNAS